MVLEKVIVGAPFGNYLKFPHTTPTLGTFTAEYRGGLTYRAWRVLRTVRYYHAMQAWTNKLGLPNPGVAYLRGLSRESTVKSIVSVSARSGDDWKTVLIAADSTKPLAIEMNVSCPNCGDNDDTDYEHIFSWAKRNTLTPLIVKLPPVNYEGYVTQAVNVAGIFNFHCCNTLPTPCGGMSGKPLQQLSLRCVHYITNLSGISSPNILIGGGGVTSIEDAQRFFDAGCTNVSVASALFFPWNWLRIENMASRAKESC